MLTCQTAFLKNTSENSQFILYVVITFVRSCWQKVAERGHKKYSLKEQINQFGNTLLKARAGYH